MSPRCAALAVLALTIAAPRSGRADEPAAAPAPALAPAPAPSAESPKRPVPDYDGRGPRPATPGETALWIPRVVLSPAYLVTEYVLRRPIGAGVSAAERADLPRKLYDFFAFGPDHKAGLVPVGFVEFNFNPSVGVYGFWDDAGFRGDHLRLHVEAWPDEWLSGKLTQQIAFDPERSLRLRVEGVKRPDRVFYGTGPYTLQSWQSRYGQQRLEASATYAWRWWRSSRIETGVGARDVQTYDGHFAGEPSLTQQAATGAFAVPAGFGGEYTAQYNRLVASIDTRDPDRPTTGVHLEAAAEQGNELRHSPASGWIRYGATVAGAVDLTGRRRVLGLAVTTLFSIRSEASPSRSRSSPISAATTPCRRTSRGGSSTAARRPPPRATAGPSRRGSTGGSRSPSATSSARTSRSSTLFSRLRLSGAFGLSIAGMTDPPLEFLLGFGTETFEHGSQMDSIRVMLGVPHTF